MIKENYTESSLKHFGVFLSPILLRQPKKTVNSALHPVQSTGYFTNACRFLSQYKCGAMRLGFSTGGLVVNHLPAEPPYVLALDYALISRCVAKIFGRGIHSDHCLKSNRARYIHGHGWMLPGLLHYCFVFSRGLCFPILCDLFIPKKNLPTNQSFKTLLQLSVEFFRQIRTNLQGKMIVIADGLYAKKALVCHCVLERIAKIFCQRGNVAMYQQRPKVSSGKRYRTMKYGTGFSFAALSFQQDHFEKYTLKMYSENHNLCIRSFLAIWKLADSLRKEGTAYFDGNKNPGYFFSTDLSISETRIIEWLVALWSIESLFDNFKEGLGMIDWQFCVRKSAVRSGPLLCVATSLLLTWSDQKKQEEAIELWDANPWYWNKGPPCIHDMLQQLEAMCILETLWMLYRDGL